TPSPASQPFVRGPVLFYIRLCLPRDQRTPGRLIRHLQSLAAAVQTHLTSSFCCSLQPRDLLKIFPSCKQTLLVVPERRMCFRLPLQIHPPHWSLAGLRKFAHSTPVFVRTLFRSTRVRRMRGLYQPGHPL